MSKAAGYIGSVVGALFGATAKTKKPEAEPVTAMPDPDDDAINRDRAREDSRRLRRGGRSGTVLSDGLG